MPKLSKLEDLRRARSSFQHDLQTREKADTRIIVGMGTCGIAAGAREVMNALMEDMAEADRQDIRVVTSGCMGMCSSEPNVTIEVEDNEPIVYQLMDSNKMRQVFKRHVLLGEVQSDFALAKM